MISGHGVYTVTWSVPLPSLAFDTINPVADASHLLGYGQLSERTAIPEAAIPQSLLLGPCSRSGRVHSLGQVPLSPVNQTPTPGMVLFIYNTVNLYTSHGKGDESALIARALGDLALMSSLW